MELELTEVVLDLTIYPRGEWSARTVERYAEALEAGEMFPPIVVEDTTNRLLDGLHRWKAHEQLGRVKIEAERHAVPNGIPPKLYAASLSVRHGDRIGVDDLRRIARETLQSLPGMDQRQVAHMLGVGRATVSRWCSDITERRQHLLAVKARVLTASGLSQRAAADVLGVSTSELSRKFQVELPGHLDDLLDDALADLGSEYAETVEQLREELVFATWTDEEREMLARHRAGETIVANQGRHHNLIRWADGVGAFERIDRKTRWGNPFILDEDGDRGAVIASYRDHYLPYKPSLLARLDQLDGKVLGCWCAPGPCHGDVLARR